nr:hypothetical protein [Pseudobdellovibrionaceae bacterium]
VIKETLPPGETILTYPLMGKARRGGNIILIDNKLNYEVGIVDPKESRFSLVYETGKTRDLKNKLKAAWIYTKTAGTQTATNFGPEFTKLFLAGYYPIAYELATAYHKGPLALKEQLDSLAHPIGYVGLASFMVANRITTSVLNDMKFKEIPISIQFKIQDAIKNSPRPFGTNFKDYRTDFNPITKRKIVDFLPINMMGMAVGMFANHVVSDTYNALKTCFFRPPLDKNNPQQALLQEQQQDEACDSVIEEITFESYSSTIVSLLASAGIAGAAMETASIAADKAVGAAHRAFIGNPNYTKTLFLGGTILSRLNQAGGIALGFRWTYKKLLKGLTGMGLFFMVDSWINEPIRDTIGNFIRSKQDFVDLESAILPKIDDIQVAVKQKELKLPQTINLKDKLSELAKAMKMWRKFKLGSIQHSHAQWIAKTENVRLLSNLTEDFYKNFLYDLYVQQKKREIKKNPKNFSDLDQEMANQKLTLLDQKFSFFGLLPFNVFLKDNSSVLRYLNPNKLEGRNLFDLYSQSIENSSTFFNDEWSPRWIEKYQYNVLFDASHVLELRSLAMPPGSKARKILAEFALALSKNSWSRSGIEKTKYDISVEKFIRYVNGLEQYHYSSGDAPTDAFLIHLYKQIGRPQILDKFGMAFSPVYFHNTKKLKEFSTSQIKIWSGLLKDLKNSRITDFLIYSMACGPNVNEKVDQFISRPTMFGYDVLYDSFNPPRIVGEGVTFDICLDDQHKSSERLKLPQILYEMYSGKIKAQYSSGKILEFDGIYSAIIQNLRSDILNYVNYKSTRIESFDIWSYNRFDIWWTQFTKTKLDIIQSDYKKEYGKLANMFLDNLYEPNKISDFSAGRYVSHGYLRALYQEIRFYGYILGLEASQNWKSEFMKDFKHARSLFGDFATSGLSSKSENVFNFQAQIEQVIYLIDQFFTKIKAEQYGPGKFKIKSEITNKNLKLFVKQIEVIKNEIDLQFSKNKLADSDIVQMSSRQIQINLKEIKEILLILSMMDWDKWEEIESTFKKMEEEFKMPGLNGEIFTQ